ncbi:hypothetical protein KUH32_14700 [Thalassococcus sp. CAU 1522]|uniref:Thioredoxin family protein n=1 Tax=Thalassococcus arenae TaxID=2851652 RepID=A0ABS6NAF5_9RHOB|nr:hypothetical protein [Thalassococcus arenae]
MRDRLQALTAPAGPAPSVTDAYAEEIAADLGRIGARYDALFGPEDAAIALFIGPDCPTCETAADELDAVVQRLGLHATVIDAGTPDGAALLGDLTLDTVPSYVMPDRLIRGHMPDFVLERYLRAAR